MKLLLDSLQPDDTVGIVVYAGAAGTVLEPTEVRDKHKIIQALDRLHAGGSTAGAEGIRQAYQLAESRFEENAVNRVILATDGDFNVGITNKEELKDFIERKRNTGIFLSVFGFGQGNYGIFLSVFGFGQGNYNDHLMQELAQNGNGVAAYIDNLNEARKVLVDEATSTLFPIAKDVKIQIEFNPQTVDEYRLIGYETRHLEREDFNNDAVDAGDIGSGHTVTAIYEFAPKGKGLMSPSRYSTAKEEHSADTDFNNEYAFLKMRYKRYKLPKEDISNLITTPITVNNDVSLQNSEPSDWVAQETGWATAVATFGQLLKGGKYVGSMNYDDVINLAIQNKGADPFGYRSEFINLVRLAKSSAAMQKN
jgi:Ca-activated chloride channel family protein